MKKKIAIHILVYLLAITVIGLLFMAARIYGKVSQERLEKTRKESMTNAKNGNSGTKVKVCRIFYIPLVDVLKLPGTVEAYEDIDLAMRIGGTIEWMGKEEGERVKKGEKILELDTAIMKAQRDRTKTALDLAEKKFTRIKELYEKNVTSHEDYDNAEAALETARTALKEAEVALEYGTLYSPLDGILDRKFADAGEHVESGRTIMKIVDIDKVKVIFQVPEKDVLFFSQGQEVDVITSGNGDTDYKGTVEFVAMTADPDSLTYPLKVVVKNPEHRLRPGMILRASLVRRRIDRAIAVPFYTLVDNERGKSVFVVEEGKAMERPIEYGIFQGGMIEITNGLKAGDLLVIVGQRNLVNGQDVTVTEDLTQMAMAYAASGKDLSRLALDIQYSQGLEQE